MESKIDQYTLSSFRCLTCLQKLYIAWNRSLCPPTFQIYNKYLHDKQRPCLNFIISKALSSILPHYTYILLVRFDSGYLACWGCRTIVNWSVFQTWWWLLPFNFRLWHKCIQTSVFYSWRSIYSIWGFFVCGMVCVMGTNPWMILLLNPQAQKAINSYQMFRVWFVYDRYHTRELYFVLESVWYTHFHHLSQCSSWCCCYCRICTVLMLQVLLLVRAIELLRSST